MSEERLLRLNQLLKKEIGQLILKECDFPPDILITVTRVEISQTLEDATVWVSVLPESKIQTIMRSLTKQVFDLQYSLNRRLRMRPIPKIKFMTDSKMAEAGRIEELLEEIKKEEQS